MSDMFLYIYDAIPPNEVAIAINYVAALGGRWIIVPQDGESIATHILVPSWANMDARFSFMDTAQAFLQKFTSIDIDELKAMYDAKALVDPKALLNLKTVHGLTVAPSVPLALPAHMQVSPTPSLTPSLVTPPLTFTPISSFPSAGWATPSTLKKARPATPYDRTPVREDKQKPQVSSFRTPGKNTPTPRATPSTASLQPSQEDILKAYLLSFVDTFDYTGPFEDEGDFKTKFWAQFTTLHSTYAALAPESTLKKHHTELESASIAFCAAYQRPKPVDAAFFAAFAVFVPTFPWNDPIVTRRNVQNAFERHDLSKPFKQVLKNNKGNCASLYWTHFFKRFRPIWNETYPRMFEKDMMPNVEKTTKKRKGKEVASGGGLDNGLQLQLHSAPVLPTATLPAAMSFPAQPMACASHAQPMACTSHAKPAISAATPLPVAPMAPSTSQAGPAIVDPWAQFLPLSPWLEVPSLPLPAPPPGPLSRFTTPESPLMNPAPMADSLEEMFAFVNYDQDE